MNFFLNRWILFLLSGYLFLVMACTPKTYPETVEEKLPPEEEPAEEPLSPCPKFSDATYPEDVENQYIIYRDFLKDQMYDRAFELWKKVYAQAPAADGKRNTVFEDGIWFYKRIYSGLEDSVSKRETMDITMNFYDEMAKCYGDTAWVGARKAFDYYYTFSEFASKEIIYKLFKNYIDDAGLETQAFAINPFTAVLLELTMQQKIPVDEARKYDRIIKNIINHNLATAKGQDLEAWQIVESYAPQRLSDFETVKGFYDCDYYIEKYYPDFIANPEDCDVIRETYSWLKWGGCAEKNPKFQKLIKTGNEKCSIAGGSGAARDAYNALKEAEYQLALDKFLEAAEQADEPDKKASYLLLAAKINYAYLKNFPQARKYALRAAKAKPNWGEPYMLIGRLYASSGPLCGPGRGWDSQVVTWVAIDMWREAKGIDAAVTNDANKLIRQYSQYMPSVEDVFQRGLKEGQSYFVPCWIQRTTTIRTAK